MDPYESRSKLSAPNDNDSTVWHTHLDTVCGRDSEKGSWRQEDALLRIFKLGAKSCSCTRQARVMFTAMIGAYPGTCPDLASAQSRFSVG